MNKLEKKINYAFKNKSFIKTALTHSSYANESKDKKLYSNERLEFLGDSVLGLITADYLYRTYGDVPEGELTKLRAAVVCEQALHKAALDFGLSEYLLLGHGEESGGGRERASILADAVEAIIGAIYLDGGFTAAQNFVLGFIKKGTAQAAKGRAFNDYKTMLQEIVQKNKEEILSYRVVSEDGPDHDKHFVVEVLLNSNIFSRGEGKSKKEAEQMAAQSALLLMGEDV